MAKTVYTGSDVIGIFDAATTAGKRMESIAITLERGKFIINPSDPITVERGSGPPDCGITIVGIDSDDANSMTSAEVMALVLSGDAPSALSWTDDAATPVSKLPANFFDYFPLSKWRVDKVDTGSGGPTDVNKWTATISPSNQNTVTPAPA
jgi:hypothetical protein